MNTEINIYQGNQIGGCITVITHTDNDGNISLIMIDYGSSLPGSGNKKEFQYPWDSEPIDAVLLEKGMYNESSWGEN